MAKYGLKYLTQLFEGWGLSKPAELAARVLSAPSKFAHLTTWLSIQALPAYRYRALGEKKDEGDLFDLWQMLYLVDMDVYVTNEKRLPRWYGDIFGGVVKSFPTAARGISIASPTSQRLA